MHELMRAEARRLHREGMIAPYIANRLGMRRRDVECLLTEPAEPEPLTWETATWASSDAVVEWLTGAIEEHRLGACGVGDSLRGWRDRGRISIWSLDRVFVALGLHVMQLPDEVWIG